jgi:hypothetical protein
MNKKNEKTIILISTIITIASLTFLLLNMISTNNQLQETQQEKIELANELTQTRQAFIEKTEGCEQQKQLLLKTYSDALAIYTDYYNCYWAFSCSEEEESCLNKDITLTQINNAKLACEKAPNYEKWMEKYWE